MTTVVLYGPPRSGKTVNAEHIAKHYGCENIFDEGKEPSHRLPALLKPRTLYITNQTPEFKSHERLDLVVIEIQDALRECGLCK